MIEFEEVVWILFTLIWVYALLDVVSTNSALVRNLPKITWVFIVFFGWVLGAGLWMFLGRPEKAGYRPGDSGYGQPMHLARGPDDNPDFLQNLRRPEDTAQPSLEAWEADLRRREEELRRREEGD